MTAGFDHGGLAAVFARFAGVDEPACLTGNGELSFADLHDQALRWAAALAGDRSPVLIFGHKEAGYLVAWWACLLAARPLVPIEPDLPLQRIRDIAAMAGAGLMLVAAATAPGTGETGLRHLSLMGPPPVFNMPTLPVPRLPDETAYILCSSGTTGQPKGIQVSYANLDGFVRWLDTGLLADTPLVAVSGNVRYCFDVSLYELWSSWLRRIPLVALDHADFFNSRRQIARYGDAGVGLWVSTPSVAQFYLRDPAFCAKALPRLKTFIFCGEVLPKPMVSELWRRFPGARVINTYGPTECTVAVTSVLITPEMIADAHSLPIGHPRPGCNLSVQGGEIVISGDVVGPGYLGLPDRQAAAFPAPWTYRTGDRAEVGRDGLWYFHGRSDREVKIQGLRIDLDEVEATLRALPGVEAAVVDLQILRGIPRAMIACLAGPVDRDALARHAAALAACLPPALVPRFWHAAAGFTLNHNCKLDRAALIHAARNGGIDHVHD